MNTMLHSIQVYIATGFVLFILIIVMAILLYALSLKKKHGIKEINYDTFRREDSLEYLKFDRIISSKEDDPFLKGEGIIQVDKRTFVGIVSVTGYNFYSASYDAQVATINSTISFLNTLEYPITLRQNVKQIDISYNIGEHEKVEKRLLEEISEKENYISDLVTEAEDNLDDNYAYAQLCMERVKEQQRVLSRLQHQLDEVREMIFYMRSISSESSDMQKVQTIVYSYTFDATQYSTNLSEEEIVFIAMQELETRASLIISFLSRMGCSGKRCSAEEIVELMRQHMHPATSDDYSVKDLFNSDLSSLFVTSESLLDVVREKLTEEEYLRQIEVMENKIEQMKRSKKLAAERAEDERLAKTYDTASSQISI